MNSTGRFAKLVAGLLAGLAASGPAVADVVASEGWVEASAPGEVNGKGYLVLTNRGEEEYKLMRIASPASQIITLHAESLDAEGKPRVWPLGSVTLAAGQSIRFEPGVRHIRFRDLAKPLTVGSKVPVLIQFDGGLEPFIVEMEVRASGPVVARK